MAHPRTQPIECTADDCTRSTVARGFCSKHYKRFRVHGSPDVVLKESGEGVVRRRKKTVEERFWPKVDKHGPDECWEWLGARLKASGKHGGGYGVMIGSGKDSGILYAHRVSYEINVGAIPADLCIDHLCCNKWCVNPAHLEAVTLAENSRRYLAKRWPSYGASRDAAA